MNWLDTATKAVLWKDGDAKLAPPKVAEYALVLGAGGTDRQRLRRAISRIKERSPGKTVARENLVVVNADLTLEDALYGQFELICCDAVAAVVRSEIAVEAEIIYLQQLLNQIYCSPEFKTTTIKIEAIPENNAGEKFVDQFLGMHLQQLLRLRFPCRFTMTAKKARIMKHWATKIGAQVADNGLKDC